MHLRGIATSARCFAQLGNIVNKVMKSDQVKKSRNKESYNASIMPSPLETTRKNKDITHKNRRVTVLNKIFMRYITDLMATGEVANQLLGRGIEITHVKVAPDYKTVNVYWHAENPANIKEDTELILKRSAGHLQHELSQLRVIGMVPPINFVKNKYIGVIKEVEKRLSQVDFGEDFVPSAYITPSQIPVIETKLSDSIKSKLEKLNEEDSEDNEDGYCEITFPEMKQNVMGFDHSYIMKKIKQSLNKSKAAEQNRLIGVPEIPKNSQVTNPEVTDFLSAKEQDKLFNDFLKQRMIENNKRKNAKSLMEAKREEELQLNEVMNKDYSSNEINIEEDYRDDYEEIESYKKS